MVRKPLPKNIETTVLIRSRRRCCICFGLDRDTRLKSGQIAHLDKNSGNHAEANLAFLCFDHHDEYDSISSQRKNFTIGEVKAFREELRATINKAFTQKVHFGEITTSPTDPYAGSYIRIDSGTDSAELNMTPLPDGYEGDVRYFISGLAIWGAERPSGPNLGTIEFVGTMDHSQEIIYYRNRLDEKSVSTKMQFFGNGELKVTEEHWIGEYGMNVSFQGRYKRAE
jgi:hypothetical protein